MTYGDMPTGLTTGTQPKMCCETCGDGPYSADRGDYFMFPDHDSVTCHSCGGDMILVREIHYFESVE